MDIKIKSLLDEYVKPAVEQDGGAIEYKSFEDGVVKVFLQGACSGCPSATLTLTLEATETVTVTSASTLEPMITTTEVWTYSPPGKCVNGTA